jgi:adenylate cyclase
MLSRLPRLLVIARTSSFAYKNKSTKAQDIGRELGVKYLLEGNVRKSNDKVRVEARLVEAATGIELWAERFDRPIADIFTLQDHVVETIVSTLKLQVSLSELGIVTRETTSNLEAYNDFLRGLSYRWRETKDDDAKAMKWFEKAIALDPSYADAYAELGATIFYDWGWQWTDDPSAVDKSSGLVQRALALNDSDPASHVIYGRILLEQRHFDEAAAETERGIELAPNDTGNSFCLASGSRDWEADTLNWSGKPAEALKIEEDAVLRDPKNGDFHLMEMGVAYYELGRPAEAVLF